jgi:hypothetical protein
MISDCLRRNCIEKLHDDSEDFRSITKLVKRHCWLEGTDGFLGEGEAGAGGAGHDFGVDSDNYVFTGI